MTCGLSSYQKRNTKISNVIFYLNVNVENFSKFEIVENYLTIIFEVRTFVFSFVLLNLLLNSDFFRGHCENLC